MRHLNKYLYCKKPFETHDKKLKNMLFDRNE